MASDQTRSAILAAAERLYADRGFGDVTLRDIVAEANVNLAAVNYHFGSKDELIAELFVTRSIQTNRERLNELKAAEEAGGGRAAIAAGAAGPGRLVEVGPNGWTTGLWTTLTVGIAAVIGMAAGPTHLAEEDRLPELQVRPSVRNARDR